MNNNIIILILIYIIFIFSIIDNNILKIISLLIFDNKTFDFIKIGLELECGKKLNNIYIYLFRLCLLIYLLLYPFINLIYVLFTNHRYDYPFFKQYYELCKNPLLIPECHCSILNGIYASIQDNELFCNMLQNKIYWNNLFVDNNIKTPEIVGIIINKKIKTNKFFDINKEYIIKPIVGGLGKYIKDYNELNIKNIDENNYIIQEKINQINTKGHFRIITIYDKKNNTHIFSNVYVCINKLDEITSNKSNGGICHEVDIIEEITRLLEIDEKIKLNEKFSVDALKKSIESAIKLHKTMPTYIITVGWDVMINNNDYYFLEGNIPHGAVISIDKYYYQKSIKINNMIYNSIF